ncbi:MAG: hypothetical protein ABIG55_00410 [Candidatus Omnitrophota bacterium]|nr:PilN domain-containing protein [Candidatus Omnitrophota bacterium]
MIELNLLPKELRKTRKISVELSDIPVVRIAVALFALLLAVHISIVLLSGRSKGELDVLTLEWGQMQPQRDLIGKLTRETGEAEKRLKVIRGIAELGLDWSDLLRGLNDAVIPKVWLSEFEVKFDNADTKGGVKEKLPVSVGITGYALGNSQEATSIVARFITSLKNNPDFAEPFKEIELHNMRAQEVAGKEAMRFMLECRLAPDVSEMAAGVQDEGKKKK